MSAEEGDSRVTIATLRGEMRTGLAEITGAVNNLTTEFRMDRESRIHADAEHDRVHGELNTQVQVLKSDVTSLKEWRIALISAESASPRLTWRTFLSDTKSAGLALIALASFIYAIYTKSQ